MVWADMLNKQSAASLQGAPRGHLAEAWGEAL